MKIRLTLFLFIAMNSLLLTSCSKNKVEDATTVTSKKIDSLLSHLHEEGQFNGAFFLANDSTILAKRVYGYANIPRKEELKQETMFEIASVSKTLTATLIMKLVQEGELGLDSKLIDYFPEMPYPDITVEHLLTHTSGIPFYYDTLIKDKLKEGRTINTDTIYKRYAELKPKQEFDTGQKFSYSNSGYMLLAGIAERATKQSFDDLLYKHIFSAAGMGSTRRDVLLSDMENYAEGHQLSVEQGAYVPLEIHEDSLSMLHYYFKDSKGPGGIYATMDDLWRFSQAIRNNAILNEEYTDLMFTPGTLLDGSATKYGKGWQLSSTDGSRYVHHRGGSEGFNCFFYIAIDEGYSYFLVSNTKSFYLSEIHKQFRNIITDQPTESIKKSAFERIALRMNHISDVELMQKIDSLRARADEYYFALHEFNELAWKYWLDGNFEEGMRVIKLATVAMPDNAGAFEVLAEAYMEMGQNELAIKNYNKTIDMLNNDSAKKDKDWVKEWITDMRKIIQDIDENSND
ncbi:serine hydrolase [Muricauda sp. NFXS6]|uniref:serine hydrolase n=1 Tax=Allomuricauda sp. NFXS6 TaxID=2819094 RepID=UPI0032DE600F